MTKRRLFIQSSLALGATTFFSQFALGEIHHLDNNLSKIKPKKLKKGATIGVIAPGYAVKKEVLETSLDALKKMGFMPVHTQRIIGNYGYFSNTDEERAADIMEMFKNPEIDGILCARGGYGCTRILHLLDYDAIQNNPKVLIGFSDVTALLNAIYKKTGLVGFHGPVGSTLDDAYSQEYLKKVVMHNQQHTTLKNVVLTKVEMLSDTTYERYTITAGTATGELIGGSLTLVTALIGTPYELDFTDKLVFLEDIEERPYRIDRMLTQLLSTSTFNKAKGIFFGVCIGCDTLKDNRNFTLKEVILDRISPMGIPAAYGFSFGHVPNNFTLPTGIMAQLDADQLSLHLLENAVV
ncbi:LD-carboxypeptidase [Flavobacterium sp. ASW18X]|uniref:S66 peptidase family protein n=1 Tax=Flavobacterium sp. ASW18X TaxID=2572595 RepID=UPI0010AE23DC|nr:LD-carboxypeptidase [Flavobacterium sp. ASW18X]TKD62380.1 LD-carboxypeptidase [Flavobacterium sp. ASW18X]